MSKKELDFILDKKKKTTKTKKKKNIIKVKVEKKVEEPQKE